MDDRITNAREALMAELLQDVDRLLHRIDNMNAELPRKMEEASSAAAAKAFLAARLNFESMIEQQAQKLTDAGRHAAALIGNQLNSKAVQLVDVNEVFARRARRFLWKLAGLTFAAGVVAGLVGAKLAGV